MDRLIERFKALSVGEKIIIIAGALLFIVGFFPWYSISFEFLGESVSASANGWQAPGAIWSIFAIFIGLAMAGVVVVKSLTEVEIPDNVGGFSWPKIFFGAGVATLAFVLIKFLNHASDLGIGFFLGIIAAGALAVAGFVMFREETAA